MRRCTVRLWSRKTQHLLSQQTKPPAVEGVAAVAAATSGSGKPTSSGKAPAHGEKGTPDAPAKKGMLATVKGWGQAAKHGIQHMYHGFRLLGVNTGVALKLTRRLQQGEALTRRERLLLEGAVRDLLRLVPFSFFIIVPFGELLLPVALKMFPNMIPSTFETESQGRNKAYSAQFQQMKARRQLMEYCVSQVYLCPDHTSEQKDVLRRMGSAEMVTVRHIQLMAPMFREDGPMALHQMPPDVIMALAKVLGIYGSMGGILPKSIFQKDALWRIQAKFRLLQEDDRQIRKEGAQKLNTEELRRACQLRTMRWIDGDVYLKMQVAAWVSLTDDPMVPYHTLFFIKPTAQNIEKSFAALRPEERSKVLGLSAVPPHVASSLQKLCDRVDVESEEDALDEKESVASMTRRIEDVQEEMDVVESRHVELGTERVKTEISNFFKAHKSDKVWDILLAQDNNGFVTVAEMSEYVASRTKLSPLAVQRVFDSLEVGWSHDHVTKEDFNSFIKRIQS